MHSGPATTDRHGTEFSLHRTMVGHTGTLSMSFLVALGPHPAPAPGGLRELAEPCRQSLGPTLPQLIHESCVRPAAARFRTGLVGPTSSSTADLACCAGLLVSGQVHSRAPSKPTAALQLHVPSAAQSLLALWRESATRWFRARRTPRVLPSWDRRPGTEGMRSRLTHARVRGVTSRTQVRFGASATSPSMSGSRGPTDRSHCHRARNEILNPSMSLIKSPLP